MRSRGRYIMKARLSVTPTLVLVGLATLALAGCLKDASGGGNLPSADGWRGTMQCSGLTSGR